MIDAARIYRLLAEIPQPPDEPLPPAASEADCEGFEQRNSIRLPDDVRQWLKIANGPCVGPGGLYGIRTRRPHLDIEYYYGIFPFWRESKWIPVAGDGCGNYFIIPTCAEYGEGFPVLFVDISLKIDKPAYIVASCVEHFLIFLFESENGRKGWPFNEPVVIASDPEIVRFVGVPLPWQASQ